MWIFISLQEWQRLNYDIYTLRQIRREVRNRWRRILEDLGESERDWNGKNDWSRAFHFSIKVWLDCPRPTMEWWHGDLSLILKAWPSASACSQLAPLLKLAHLYQRATCHVACPLLSAGTCLVSWLRFFPRVPYSTQKSCLPILFCCRPLGSLLNQSEGGDYLSNLFIRSLPATN